jgi:lysophospholipase
MNPSSRIVSRITLIASLIAVPGGMLTCVLSCKPDSPSANRAHPAGHAQRFAAAVSDIPSASEIANTYQITTEAELVGERSDAIQQNFARGRRNTFQGVGNAKIAYGVFPAAPSTADKGAIVISAGRTESLLIYPEIIYDLGRQGYAVYIHDHRGQGTSDHLLADRQRGHVVRFSDYVDDLKTFVEKVVKPDGHRKRYLLAHSMGGGIASLYLEKYPDDFAAAVLVTPMHEPLLPLGAETLCKANEAIPDAHLSEFALKQGPYNPPPFVANDLTHSKVRFQRIHSAYRTYRAETGIDPTIGGPTHGWVREACSAGKAARANVNRVQTPVLLFQASHDTAVGNAAQEQFCHGVNAAGRVGCEAFVVEHAFHALLMEADTFRVPMMNRLLKFLAEH